MNKKLAASTAIFKYVRILDCDSENLTLSASYVTCWPHHFAKIILSQCLNNIVSKVGIITVLTCVVLKVETEWLWNQEKCRMLGKCRCHFSFTPLVIQAFILRCFLTSNSGGHHVGPQKDDTHMVNDFPLFICPTVFWLFNSISFSCGVRCQNPTFVGSEEK